MDHTRIPLPPLLDAVKQAAAEELHRRLRSAGHPLIRPAHGCVFRFVQPEGSRLTHLAEQAGLTKQAVGEFVSELEELGYVERVPDPTDGRAKIVRLTEQGSAAQRLARETFFDIERAWAEQVGEERVEIMRETLEDILDLVTREKLAELADSVPGPITPSAA